jgi:alpha-amylase
MLENLDYSNEELVQETNEWGEWIVKSLGLKGFRMDAVQHYSWHMTDSWSKHLKSTCGESLFFVGEFWHGDVNVLTDWLDNINPDFCLYDVPLMYNMAKLSWHENSDLRDVFRHTLVEQRPKNSFVSFLVGMNFAVAACQ